MAHEKQLAAVLAAEKDTQIQKSMKIGFFRISFGIISSIFSLFGISLFLILLISYGDPTIEKEDADISLIVIGIFSSITAVLGYFLLKPLLKNIWIKMKSDIHESGKSYAGFWRRLGAGLIDFAILSPIYFVWYFLGTMDLIVYEFAYWGGIASTVYTLLMVTFYGQTVGKMVFKIKIYKVNGDKVAFYEALKRIYGEICIWVVFIIAHIITLSKTDLSKIIDMTYNQIDDYLSEQSSWELWGALLSLLWIVCELITLLFNKRKRAIHDFIAGTIMLVENESASMHK